MRKIILCLLAILMIAGCGNSQSEDIPEPEYTEEALQEMIPEMTGDTVEYESGLSLKQPTSSEVSFDEDMALYVNNVVILFGEHAKAEEMASELGASIVGGWDEIEMYQMQFADSKTDTELQSIIDKCEARGLKGHIDYVSYSTIDYEPADDWGKGQDWNEDHPSGNNWGVEAIHAPTAWNYLGRIKKVNLGIMECSEVKKCNELNVVKALNAKNGATDAKNTRHANHVAAIMAAKMDNGGIAGVCAVEDTQIYSLASYSHASVCNDMSGILSLILDYNCKVINVSMGYADNMIFAASRGNKKARNVVEKEAEWATTMLMIALAKGKEFVICSSAGNTNNDKYYKTASPYTKNFLPSYGYTDVENDPLRGKRLYSGDVDAYWGFYLNAITQKELKDRIIVVGAVTLSKGKTASIDFSCLGNRVDVMAPGVSIYSYVGNNAYDYISGTSMATPFVTGTAGLLFGCKQNISGAEVKKIICDTADKSIKYDGVSAGLLRVDKAVEALLGNDKPLIEYMGMERDKVLKEKWDKNNSQGYELSLARGDAEFYFLIANGGVAIAEVRDETGKSEYPVTDEVALGMSYVQVTKALPNTSALDVYEMYDYGTDKNTVLGSASCRYNGYELSMSFKGGGDDAILSSVEIMKGN